MSSLFGKPNMPAPAPVPVAPTAPDNKAAEADRLKADRAAIADSKARGRASTIKAGAEIAADEQYSRGLLKKRQRSAASAEVFG